MHCVGTLPSSGGLQRQLVRPRQAPGHTASAGYRRRLACQAASAVSSSEPGREAPAAAAKDGPSATPAREQPPQPQAATATAPGANAGQTKGASSQPGRSLLSNHALLRKLAAANTFIDVADVLSGEGLMGLSEEDALAVMQFYLQRGKTQLVLSLYREMCAARRTGGAARGGRGSNLGSGSLDVAFAWPPAGLQTTTELVLGLSQQLCIVEALQVLSDIKVQSLPRGSEEVGFGKVITSPLAPDRPLTVVQPQEGAKVVADGYSRYEFEVFSGTAVSVNSTALQAPGNILLGLVRAIGLVKKPPVAAIHEFVLKAPDGTSRTFRVGTDSASVPCQVGERVTVVSSPQRNVRQGGLFNASPPGTKPGESLTATNHKTGQVLTLLRPPVSNQQQGIPSWVLPAAVILAGGDAASSLLDPNLPLLIAAGAASVSGSALLGTNVLVPRLKQLPEPKVRVEYVRQQLLGQYNQLAGKAAAVLNESAEDVRFLARLWQLQNKMEAVGGSSSSSSGSGGAGAAVAADAGAGAGSGSGGAAAAAAAAQGFAAAAGASSAYEARIGRVSRARANIEERLARKVELLDGYSRVMNMIEIEVEMDIEVPAAEVAGIQQQVDKLIELENLQEDWRAQAEARDEVERLLRTA